MGVKMTKASFHQYQYYAGTVDEARKNTVVALYPKF
jgi:hypothetical protein